MRASCGYRFEGRGLSLQGGGLGFRVKGGGFSVGLWHLRDEVEGLRAEAFKAKGGGLRAESTAERA
eukprot:2213881-Pleurochrysis_carterae.AAC.1